MTIHLLWCFIDLFCKVVNDKTVFEYGLLYKTRTFFRGVYCRSEMSLRNPITASDLFNGLFQFWTMVYFENTESWP